MDHNSDPKQLPGLVVSPLAAAGPPLAAQYKPEVDSVHIRSHHQSQPALPTNWDCLATLVHTHGNKDRVPGRQWQRNQLNLLSRVFSYNPPCVIIYRLTAVVS